MLKENHFRFRVCKQLACVSRLIFGYPLQTSSRTFSGVNVLFKDTCYEHLKVFNGKCDLSCDAERVKLCSRASRICIANHCLNLLSARSLFTCASARANTHTTTGRNSTDNRKTNLDLKTKTARKPAAKNPTIGSRRTSNQKVSRSRVSYYVIIKKILYPQGVREGRGIRPINRLIKTITTFSNAIGCQQPDLSINWTVAHVMLVIGQYAPFCARCFGALC